MFEYDDEMKWVQCSMILDVMRAFLTISLRYIGKPCHFVGLRLHQERPEVCQTNFFCSSVNSARPNCEIFSKATAKIQSCNLSSNSKETFPKNVPWGKLSRSFQLQIQRQLLRSIGAWSTSVFFHYSIYTCRSS